MLKYGEKVLGNTEVLPSKKHVMEGLKKHYMESINKNDKDPKVFAMYIDGIHQVFDFLVKFV